MAALWKLLGFNDSYPPQVVYICLVEGVGAMIISGGLEFAIAYGMYHNSSKAVTLFNINENTLSGDAGVTVIIQMILTWVIAAMMVCNDVRNGLFLLVPLHPLASSLGPSNASRPGRGQTLTQAYVNVESMDLLAPGITLGRRFTRLLRLQRCRSVLCGFLFCIPVFILWWPVATGALTAPAISTHYGNRRYRYNHYPTPQVFKVIFGGTMGLLTTPVISYLALLAMGRLPSSGTAPAELQKGKGGTQAAADPNMSYNGLAGGNNHAAPVDAHSEAHDVAVKV